MSLSTLEVERLIQSVGEDNITWSLFDKYSFEDIGSGNYVYKFILDDGNFLYLAGPSLEEKPWIVYICYSDGEKRVIYSSEIQK